MAQTTRRLRRSKKGSRRFVGFWLSHLEAAQVLSAAISQNKTISDYCRAKLGFESDSKAA